MKKPTYYKKVTHDMRKTDNPRNGLLSFRADDKTVQRLKEEAKKKGISISKHLNDKLTK